MLDSTFNRFFFFRTLILIPLSKIIFEKIKGFLILIEDCHGSHSHNWEEVDLLLHPLKRGSGIKIETQIHIRKWSYNPSAEYSANSQYC